MVTAVVAQDKCDNFSLIGKPLLNDHNLDVHFTEEILCSQKLSFRRGLLIKTSEIFNVPFNQY